MLKLIIHSLTYRLFITRYLRLTLGVFPTVLMQIIARFMIWQIRKERGSVSNQVPAIFVAYNGRITLCIYANLWKYTTINYSLTSLVPCQNKAQLFTCLRKSDEEKMQSRLKDRIYPRIIMLNTGSIQCSYFQILIFFKH